MSTRRTIKTLSTAAILALTLSAAADAGFVVSFSKEFQPDTIGPGSTSELRFEITNTDPVDPVGNIAFTDVLPAGVVLATPASPFTDCGNAMLSAPDGGTTISLTDAELGADSGCSVTVFVTSSVPGTHSNVSGALTSDAGGSPGATDDLIVDVTRPGITKSFTPSSIPQGGTSTLTLLVDNSAAGAVDNFGLNLSDQLPAELFIATPPNASTDCGHPAIPPTLIAVAGSDVVQLNAFGFAPSFPALPAASTCSVTVDVTTDLPTVFVNVTGELTDSTFPDPLSSGFAVATLDVPIDFLSKRFTDDPSPPGGTVTLEFTILNLDRLLTADDISFTDDLDAALSGLEATGLPLADPCGGGSSLSGVSFLTLTGGTLGPEESCTFSVTLQVPGGAAPGAYPNTTSAVTSDIWTGNAAADVLVVATLPDFTKSFLVDPVAAGDTTTLEFTITNTSATSAASDIEFFDQLTTFLPFPLSVTLPAAGFCGPGAAMTLTIRPGDDDDEQGLLMTGGSLEPAGMAEDSCTFTVDVDIPPGMAAGTYVNTTDALIATVDAATLNGLPATATLTVVAAPQPSKEFTDDPVSPGGTVTLEFTLTHDPFAPADATGVTFTDDLAATFAGLAATGLPLTDLCGPGNGTLTGSAGDTFLTFSGATLTPGEVCTFQVTLQVPGGADAGIYSNTTSQVTATVDGIATSGNPAQDDVVVTGFLLTKSFIDDPALPGATVTLRFTLDGTTGSSAANNVIFIDDFTSVLADLTVLAPLPVAPCGGTLTAVNADQALVYSGGSVAAAAECSFDVTLQVPPGAADGLYLNVTSSVTAELPNPPAATLPPATDSLTVVTTPLLLSKSFTDDPTLAGGSVTLEFTLTNSFSLPASAIGFSDDLGAALAGLVATGLPASACGGTLSGTSPITLSGASLGAGGSCTFSVTLAVPPGAPAGSYVNTTSAVSGTIDGLAVSGDPASDTLRVQAMTFSKAFDGPTVAGGSPVLTFTILNDDGVLGVFDVAFGDDLDAVLPGLVATGLPMNDVCGAGSQLTGSSLLLMTGGSLGPSGSCVIPVTLQVPAGAAAGTYPNTTTSLFLGGIAATVPATAGLVVEPPPAFGKSFSPDLIAAGGVSTLVFTIDNSGSSLAAASLDFTDNLPTGLTIASPANASTDCTVGILTADAGTAVVSYTGGTVAASSSCSVQVDVTSAVEDEYLNITGELTSSSGASGTASAALTVGFIFVDGFESGDVSVWSSSVP